MIVALVSDCADMDPRLLHAWTHVLRTHSHNIAALWECKAPAVAAMTMDDMMELHNGPETIPLVFLDEKSDRGFLADHRWDRSLNSAACRVFMPNFRDNIDGAFLAASHEFECLVNPRVNQWVTLPGAAEGTLCAKEICDPVQTQAYPIVGIDAEGERRTWYASNFVTPFWFDTLFSTPERAQGIQLDWMRRLKFSGEIAEGGYIPIRSPTGISAIVGESPKISGSRGYRHFTEQKEGNEWQRS